MGYEEIGGRRVLVVPVTIMLILPAEIHCQLLKVHNNHHGDGCCGHLKNLFVSLSGGVSLTG